MSKANVTVRPFACLRVDDRSLSQSEVSYGQIRESGMSFDSMTAAVHPYFGFSSTDGKSQVMAMTGYGENKLELKQETYLPEILKVHHNMVAIGRSRSVYSLGSFGNLQNLELSVAGDAWYSRQFADSVAGVTDSLQVEARQMRIVIEEAHEHHIGVGGTIQPSLTIGLRGDGRNENSAYGLNVGSSVKYDAFSGLEVLGSGKSFLTGLNRLHSWEIGSSLDYDSDNYGKGVLFRMSHSWSDTDEDTEPYLWGSELADDSNSPARSLDGGSMEIEVGYGFEIPGGTALVTPYSAISQSKSHGSEFQVGNRLKTKAGIELGLETGRIVPESGSIGHEYNLTGSFNW